MSLKTKRAYVNPTDKRNFMRGINERRLVEISFISKEDDDFLIRKCVPFDFGPSKIYKDSRPRYHFYDLDSDSPKGPEHNLALESRNINWIHLTNEEFDPAQYVDFSPSWFIERDWGPEQSNPPTDWEDYYQETSAQPGETIKTPSAPSPSGEVPEQQAPVEEGMSEEDWYAPYEQPGMEDDNEEPVNPEKGEEEKKDEEEDEEPDDWY